MLAVVGVVEKPLDIGDDEIADFAALSHETMLDTTSAEVANQVVHYLRLLLQFTNELPRPPPMAPAATSVAMM